MSNGPDSQSSAVTAMKADWAVIDDVLGGTKAMRSAGTKHLPQWPKEQKEDYDRRLNQSTLLPVLSETIQNMTGRVFAEPIVPGDDIPPQISILTEDMDRQGNNLAVWSKDWFSKGLGYGLCHVLVDYPKVEGVRTLADEKKIGARPYAVIINPRQVLGWRQQGDVLTQFRYMETVSEDDGDFGSKDIQQIRVLGIGTWEIYRKDKEGAWFLHDKGITSLPVVPVVTFYTRRTGFMTAVPPLMDLTYLNIKHWQSQSDQDNILHIARVPILALIGLDPPPGTEDGKANSEQAVGAGTVMLLPLNGDAKYVEHTGKAIEAGRVSLKDLVEDCRIAGAKLLQPGISQTKTATQADDEAANNLSPLETMAESFEDALDQVLQLMAMWRGLPDGGHVEVRGNFDIDYAPEVSLPQLISMCNTGALSKETLFNEFQRRRVISDEITWADELERIEGQGVSLPSL